MWCRGTHVLCLLFALPLPSECRPVFLDDLVVVVPPVVVADDAAPGEEEKYDNETAIVVVWFGMRGVGHPR